MTPGPDSSPNSSLDRSQQDLAQRVLGLIDLTSLGSEDTEQDVIQLCLQASGAPSPVASVCVWPRFAALAVKQLEGSQIPVCAVANFPLGANDLELATSDALAIVGAGANEVDVVIPWQALAAGERGVARHLVSAVRDAIGDAPVLKAILETGELSDPELIALAASESIAGGADFLKTSTGKTARSATPEAARILLELIAHQTRSGGSSVGLKISGGVRTLSQAGEYLELADEIMGADWVDRSRFRFGASSLLDDVIKVLEAS